MDKVHKVNNSKYKHILQITTFSAESLRGIIFVRNSTLQCIHTVYWRCEYHVCRTQLSLALSILPSPVLLIFSLMFLEEEYIGSLLQIEIKEDIITL